MSLRGSVTNDIQSFNGLFITSTPLSCDFQAFYCTDPLDVLRTPEDGDSILNAWMPPDEEIEMIYTTRGVCIISCHLVSQSYFMLTC
jgi:hypothetical protein